MNEEYENKYFNFTINQLKDELRKRGARLSGRKAELIERLKNYDKNANFGFEPIEEDEIMHIPSPELYKDIHNECPAPKIIKKHLDLFCKIYDKNPAEAIKMYESGYLRYIRFCIEGDDVYFAKGQCRSSRGVHTQYLVNVKLAIDGEILESSCECVVGFSLQAHCKHVIVLILALIDFNQRKEIILEETGTQKLQTFHQPRKKFKGSPMKAHAFKRNSKINSNHQLDLQDEDYQQWYRDNYKNILINRGFGNNMSLKMILEPANPFAVEWDHSLYTKDTNEYRLLRSLSLINLSDDELKKIEHDTQGQSNNKLWYSFRSNRLTASKFHSICHVKPEGTDALVKKILDPTKSTSKPTTHGLIYEDKAVDTFNEINHFALDIKECGLFISKQYPHLAATPDRLLAETSIIEVKCPYSSRFSKINEITVPYLKKDEDGNLILKKNHPYFYQIQGQLFVTDRLYCDFIIYTFKDFLRISIERDNHFIEEMIFKLNDFWKNYMKPAILQKYLYRNYDKIFKCNHKIRE